ncbi:unnamed protein product [Porites lobata]|uniref:Uncharacterized protein n=1 Tax=Porites lobata TaxID=104759 RepID=A0ABN8RJ84_9CNID|nr:unnamed protein product [Porites lobata]
MTLELSFGIASFTILLVVMSFVIKIYLAFTSTCGGSKPFSLEGAERENQERVIREPRDLEAGIPWNNDGAGRTGELKRQRVPVEHDERLCPGMHQDDSDGTLYVEDYAKVKIDDDDDDNDDDAV